MKPSAPVVSLSDDLDAFDGRVVFDRGERDDDLSGRGRGGGEVAQGRLVLGAGRREDVEARQDGRAVDRDVEGALARGGPEELGEVKAHGVRRQSDQARQRIGDVAVSLALVHRLRSGVGQAGGGDAVRDRASGAPAEKLIGAERRHCAAAAGVDAIDRGGRRRHRHAGGPADASAGGRHGEGPARAGSGGEEATRAERSAAGHAPAE